METLTRVFTLDEARRSLPLVRKIAGDLQTVVRDIGKIPGGFSVLLGADAVENLPEHTRGQVAECLQRFHDLGDELQEIGAELKGIDPILVDFRSVRDGKEICLCWVLGEDDISYWHTTDAGFRGRKEL